MIKNTLKQNEYSWSAKYYDELCNEHVVLEDFAFYKSFINKESSILELGCGTGRVGIKLGAIVKKYVGLDLSPEMIEVFETKIKNASGSFTLITGDMTDYEINQKFDLIIFPFRAFQALVSNEQRIKCLALCNEHLKNNGKVIIQMFNPKLDSLEKLNAINTLDNTIQDGRYKIERHTIGKEHNRENQTISVFYLFKVFEEGRLLKTIEEPLFLGYLTEAQAKKLYQQQGFSVINVYKWWDFSPVDEELKELIFVLQKKKGIR